MDQEPTMKEVMSTLTDVLESLNDFATRTETRLDRLETKQDKLENFVTTNIVTKSYLDDKLFDKESDSGMALRKEDQKVDAVVGKLEEKKIINKQEATLITAMSPFAVLPN